MKNIVAKLTLRQLKLNFRRTLISIIGIALSVTMLTATSSLVTSFLAGMKTSEINMYGEWHTRIDEMPFKNYGKIKETVPNVGDTMLLEWEGFAPIQQMGNKRFFYIEGYSKNTFERFPVTMKEGRLPEKNGEIIISYEAAKAGYKIGQSFTLDLGYRARKHKPDYNKGETDENAIEEHLSFYTDYKEEGDYYYEEEFYPTNSKTYTIVGVFSNRARYYTAGPVSDSPAFEAISFLDPATITPDRRVSPLILFDKLNTDIFENTEIGCKKLGGERTSHNSGLLQYYGISSRDEFTRAIFTFVAIIIIVILIGSVAFIYNAFAISLADRSKYLGLLACVGATKKQKRYSVLLEGAVLGAISIPLGLLAGFGGIGVTLRLLSEYLMKLTDSTTDFHLVITPATVIASVLLGVITIIISLWKPARKASKTSAIEAVRQSNDIKVTKKQVKTSRLTKKLFGFEGDLAMKNIKRNKGRYRITVTSLAVSIALFLVTVCGVNLAKSAYIEDVGANTKHNVSIYSKYYVPADSPHDAFKKAFEELSKSPNTEWISLSDSAWISAFVPANEILDNEVARSADRDIATMDKSKNVMDFTLVSLDNAEFDRYLEQIGKNPNTFPKDSAVFVNYSDKETIDEKTEKEIKIKGKLLKNVPNEFKFVNVIPAEYKKVDLSSINNLMDLKSVYVSPKTGKADDTKYFGIPVSSVKVAAVTEKLPDDIFLRNGTIVVREETFENIRSEYAKVPIEQYESFITNIYLKTLDNKEANVIYTDILSKSDTQWYTNDKVEELKTAQTMITLISVFSGGFIALIILICIANIFNTISTGIALRKREFAMLKSTGMTPKAFNRMISYESLFYALKALLYGVPVSMIIAVILKFAIADVYETAFIAMFPWLALIIAAVSILVLVGGTAFYALRRINKEPIMDVLKDENI